MNSLGERLFWGNILYHRPPYPETLDINIINIQTLLHNQHTHLCSSGQLREATEQRRARVLHAGIHRVSIPQQQPALAKNNPPETFVLPWTMMLAWSKETPLRGWLAWCWHGAEENAGGWEDGSACTTGTFTWLFGGGGNQ